MATRFDSWLVLIFLARVAMYANFMVYAACLPILLNEWDMSATQAGSISSAFMIGYALSLSLFVFAWLADHFGAKRLFILSAVMSASSALLFGLFAHSYLTAYCCMPLPQSRKAVSIRRRSCCSRIAMTPRDVVRRLDI